LNTIEDRIRAAARAAADTVPPDSVPPLRLPAGRPSRFHWQWDSRSSGVVWAGRLAPVAAALAVVAIVILVVTLSRTASESSSSTSTAAPGGVTPGPPISTYVRSGQVPPYYVAITSHGDPNSNPSYAVVQATVDGKTLATINPTAGSTIVAVTAAADDRTFVLSVQHWVPRGGEQTFEARTFYMVQLNSSGQPGPLTKLPMSVPSGGTVSGLALSPSGRKLAIAVEPNNNKKDLNLQELRVYTLGTRAVRTWKGDGLIGSDPDDTKSVSWTADERTLAFDWSSASSGSASSGSVRLLNVGARGGSLLADSRPQAFSPVPRAEQAGGPSPYPPACQQDLIITPDGSSVVCGAIQGIEHTSNGVDHGRDAVTEFREYSTATGKIVRVFGHWTFARIGTLAVNVLWSNSSGSLLIGVIPTTGTGRVGVISGNTFTPIPGQGNSTADQSGAW
jgi:hypothetical protein